jgi:hypothetical protein
VNLHLDVLARPQHRHRLLGVHRRGGREDHRADVVAGEYGIEVGPGPRDAVGLRRLFRLPHRVVHHGDDSGVTDRGQGVKVLRAERTRADQRDPDRSRHAADSSTMWPTAVLDAGTW